MSEAIERAAASRRSGAKPAVIAAGPRVMAASRRSGAKPAVIAAGPRVMAASEAERQRSRAVKRPERGSQ